MAEERMLGPLFRTAQIPLPNAPNEDALSITQVTDDSRSVIPGACFVAVRGERFDGRQFINEAVRRGAVCVVAEDGVDVPDSVALVCVADARSALARLAYSFAALQTAGDGAWPRLIGVTGTNGKTTACAILRSILHAAGQTCGLLGTVSHDLVSRVVPSSMTTPGPVELAGYLAEAGRAGARWMVMEVSSHALDQRRCDGLQFAAGVFTNLTGDHLDYHGDMDGYLGAKKRLFDLIDDDGVAAVNADDPAWEALTAECRGRTVRFGIEEAAEVSAKSIRCDAKGTRFAATISGSRMDVSCPLVGRHNVMNALAAAATASALGIPLPAIARGLEQCPPVRGRVEPVSVPDQPFSVFVDYAHTDDALRNVLSALRPIAKKRLICVFGCGGDRDRSKRPRMAAVVGEIADVAVVTSDNPRNEDPEMIIDDIMPGFGFHRNYDIDVEADRRGAIELAVDIAGPGDVVLIAGKGHEQVQIVGDRRLPFDDVTVAREALSQKAYTEEAVR